jgi:hypothetical protein
MSPKANGDRWFIFGCALGTGIPGLISIVAERAFGKGINGFQNVTLTCPIAYGCYSVSKDQRGLEYGVCAPYVSYGRAHPILGDRISVFFPFVGSVQMTKFGAVGMTVHLPLFTPFVRLGLTILIKHPKLAGTCSGALGRIDDGLLFLRTGFRRALAAVTR